jgi:predicted PurR-regulated permease PerM
MSDDTPHERTAGGEPSVRGDGGSRSDGGTPTSDGHHLGPGPFAVRRDRVVLWLVAALLLAALTYVTWRFVGTVVLGLFAYYVTRPVFARFERRLDSRTLAVVVALLTVALPVLVLVGWTIAVAVRSLAGVFDSDIGAQITDLAEPYVDVPAIAADLTTTIRTLLEDPSRLASLELGPGLSDAFGVIVGTVGELFAFAIHGFIVLIIVFYLLRDDYRIAAWARTTVAPSHGVVEQYLRAVDRDLKNVFFGNILNALLTGFLAVVTYVLLNLVAPEAVAIPEPVLVGLLVGAASLVPVIGIKLLTIPISVYLFGQALLTSVDTLWFPVLFVVISFVVVDYIPDQLLRPYVSGRSLHVGAVMLAYTVGPFLFGWYGIFLGPLILVVIFEFGRIVVPWLLADGDASDLPPLDREGQVDDADAAPSTTAEDAAVSGGDAEDSDPGPTEESPTD